MKLKTVKSILAAALCAAVGFAASAAEPIEYLDWDAENGEMTNAVCTTYEVVTAATTSFADGKWYVVTNGSEIARGRITVSGSAHLILCDGGSLAVQGSENSAGVTVIDGYALTIYGQTGGSGKLVARGGYYAAGIGGGYYRSGGTVTINGGTVTATGGYDGAGIGGGEYGNAGTVTINGGTVTATGDYDGAGIGGGYEGNGGTVTINGGTVTATGDYDGAGIGGGEYGNAGTVTINGGTVTATGEVGIGGYEDYEPGTLSVSGGRVKASGSRRCLWSTLRVAEDFLVELDGVVRTPGEDGSVELSWNERTLLAEEVRLIEYADVTYLDENGASQTRSCQVIEGCRNYLHDGQWYVVPGGADLTNNWLCVVGSAHLVLCDGGKLTLTGEDGEYAGVCVTTGKVLTIYGQSAGTGELFARGGRGAGIGGYVSEDSGTANGGTVAINGGTVTASGSRYGAGIGGGENGNGGTVTISGGTVTATGGESGAGIGGGRNGNGGTVTINGGTVTASGSECGAGIGGGYYGNGGTVTIKGGTVTASGSKYGAGIGGGEYGNGGTVTISGGTVTANGGKYGAGIGGGEYGNGDTVTISGGTVTATGGYEGAGIGGGEGGSGGTVTINDGTVTATGGECGAGIGGGYWSDGGEVTIKGGTVTARGGDAGAGIGGGCGVGGGIIAITGGEVTATGGNAGAGIGGGKEGNGGTVAINGGTVTATGGEAGAGIGGGEYGNGGEVTINGGAVTATGGDGCAGIGGGYGRSGGMLTFGEDFHGIAYAGEDAASAVQIDPEDYDGETYVRILSAVKLSIPAVPGCACIVSNATDEIRGTRLNGVNTYWVAKGDAVDVYFALQTGSHWVTEPTANPMSLGVLTEDRTLDLGALPTVRQDPVTYLDWDAANGVMTNAVATVYEVVTETTDAFDRGRTCVVLDDVVINKAMSGIGIRVDGTAAEPSRLVLCDGATLTVLGEPAILVTDDGEVEHGLVICGQTAGTGKLTAGSVFITAIGGGAEGEPELGGYAACGAVTINGGEVTAIGGNYGAGIGGGFSDYVLVNGGTVTINGGTVAATGGYYYGAGIGGGVLSSGCVVTVNGGEVTATGGAGGAGIGGGYFSSNCVVTVNGGQVTATGGVYAQAIGDGYEGGGTVVTFAEGAIFAVQAGDGEGSATYVTQTAYVEDHSAMYVKLQPGCALKIPMATTGYAYAVTNTTTAKAVPPMQVDATNVYAFATNDSYAVAYTLAYGYGWVTEPTANPLTGTITTDTELPAVSVKALGADIEFDAMGGVHTNGHEVVTNFCLLVYTLPTVRRDGYTFTGWFESWTNGAAVVTNGQGLLAFEPHPLYAKWTSNAPTPRAGELVVPDVTNDVPVTSIEAKQYVNDTSLKSVTTPLYLKSIGQRAFMGCTSLEKLTITPARNYDDLSPVTVAVGQNAFSGCTSLEVLTISGDVSLGQSAFQNCAKLKKIVFLGDGAIDYGASAFYRCGYQNGTDELKVYMSSAFQSANEDGLIADLKRWNTQLKIIEKVDVTPVEGGSISIGALNAENLALNNRRLAILVKTSVQGTPDPDDVDVEFTTDISGGWTPLPAEKTANPDGTVLIEVTVPEGSSGFFRAVVK